MKLKLLCALFLITLLSWGQTITSETFDGLTVGNIAGQGTWATFLSPGGTTTNISEASFQVTANTGDNSSNGFTILGPDGDGGGIFAWNNGFPTAWAGRTSGNDIVEVEVKVNPGGTGSGSLNAIGFYIYNGDFSRVLAGFSIDADTNEISVVAWSLPSGQLTPNNFAYSLGPLILASNTFTTIGVSYNSITGEVLIDGEGFGGPFALDTNTATTTPAEVDFYAFTAAGNTVASSMIFDDLSVRATATNTLLSTEEIVKYNKALVYPNPARDFITIESNYGIESIQLYNNLGQLVVDSDRNHANKTELNISDLRSGIYLLNIKSTDGKIENKKFVKN